MKKSKAKRPYVLAYYDKSVPEMPDGGRNPYDAYEYELVMDGTEEARAQAARSKGIPVDILTVRMSAWP